MTRRIVWGLGLCALALAVGPFGPALRASFSAHAAGLDDSRPPDTQAPLRRHGAAAKSNALLAQSGHAPASDAIFEFHPKGNERDGWRQPVIVDPNEGPIKIRRWTPAELAAADAQRLDLGLRLHGQGLKNYKPPMPPSLDALTLTRHQAP